MLVVVLDWQCSILFCQFTILANNNVITLCAICSWDRNKNSGETIGNFGNGTEKSLFLGGKFLMFLLAWLMMMMIMNMMTIKTAPWWDIPSPASPPAQKQNLPVSPTQKQNLPVPPTQNILPDERMRPCMQQLQ